MTDRKVMSETVKRNTERKKGRMFGLVSEHNSKKQASQHFWHHSMKRVPAVQKNKEGNDKESHAHRLHVHTYLSSSSTSSLSETMTLALNFNSSTTDKKHWWSYLSFSEIRADAFWVSGSRVSVFLAMFCIIPACTVGIEQFRSDSRVTGESCRSK